MCRTTNSKRVDNGPEDLEGLKLRTMEHPVNMAADKGFGLTTTPMGFSEVLPALQLTGHADSPASLLMNKASVDKMPPADPTAFQATAREAVKANRARADEDDAQGVAKWRSKVVQFIDNLDKARFRAEMGPVYTPFESQLGKAGIDRIRGLK